MTKQFLVYHTKSWALNANLHFNTEGYVPNKDDYERVALVECEELGQTFQATNHIDVAWWENPEVTLIKESRSTSVGDIVEDEDCKLWLCESVGWRPILEGWAIPEKIEADYNNDKYRQDQRMK